MAIGIADPRGSIWRRWDPHLHTPGTVLADEYGDDAWEEFLCRIEDAEPPIEALGITDYASLDRYEEVVQYQKRGRLQNVKLIFPNVELRLSAKTNKGSAVNVHLLVSPEEPDHVEKTRRFLEQLTFPAGGEEYRCCRSDLIALGRYHRRDPRLDELAALREGTLQFKVSYEDIHEAFRKSAWAQKNILFAVAAGSDGTSGLRDEEGAFARLRQEIEARAHVIFSGRRADQEFWRGEKKDKNDAPIEPHGGTKPCLHGSDAHKLDKVGAPDHKRYTWIKGDPTFEALRQACIDPERAYVGPEPPAGPLPSRTIRALDIDNAPWCATSRVEFNGGLVGIIGPRGSGKTALADFVAAAARVDVREHKGSFVERAGRLLGGARVTLHWCDGQRTECVLGQDRGEEQGLPRVRYLSQRFVEELCGSEQNDTSRLVSEIKRVIYDACPADLRAGTSDFEDLVEKHARDARARRKAAVERLNRLAHEVALARRDAARLEVLERQRDAKRQELKADQKSRDDLLAASGEKSAEQQRAARGLREIAAAIERRSQRLDAKVRQKEALLRLRDTARRLREVELPARHEELREQHRDAGLADAEWKAFELVFAGDVDGTLSRKLASVEADVGVLTGSSNGSGDTDRPSEVRGVDSPGEALRSSLALREGADLDRVPLDELRAEEARLRAVVDLGVEREKQLKALGTRIEEAKIALTSLERKIEDAKRAGDRIAALREQQLDAYQEVFEALVQEQADLQELAKPLEERLKKAGGACAKISVAARRRVRVEEWAGRAEQDLLDLRRRSKLQGRGELTKVAKQELQGAWERGDGCAARAAMKRFLEAYEGELRRAARLVDGSQTPDDRWNREIESWLMSVDHVEVAYSLEYDGVDITQVSPGTRGIALLLLYLVQDDTDSRPLIIDQPEDNLDPRSVYADLVGPFKEIRKRRQVILVTHNANLIVNTDADQVIVAGSERGSRSGLPVLRYESGALENERIRSSVCEILEGGKEAFEARARRLRVAPTA